MSYFDDASLVMIPSGYKDQKVYSVKPLDGSGDLTFSRASSATRVASNGLIEKVRTNQFPKSTAFTTSSFFATYNVSPVSLGTYPVDSSSLGYSFSITGTNQGFIFTLPNDTNIRCVSVYLKDWNTVDIYYTGSAPLTTISDTGTINGYKRFVVVIPAGANNLYFRPNSNNGTVTTVYATAPQVEYGDYPTAYIVNDTTASVVSVGPVSGLPRLDYLNSTCPRLLLEPQRTNLITYSEQLNTGSGGTTPVTANTAVSPDGYTNADTIGTGYWTKSTSQSAGTYTLSVFAKYQSAATFGLYIYDGAYYQGTFNLQTGVATPASGSPTVSMVSYGNGWYRCTLTATTASTISEVGFGSGNFYGYGLQLEAGAYATSYIPTLGTSVTRVADAASKTGISSLIGQTEGTLFIDIDPQDISGSGRYISIEAAAGIGSGWIGIFASGATPNTLRFYGDGFDFSAGLAPRGVRTKAAFAYKNGVLTSAYVNGASVGTLTANTTGKSYANLVLSSAAIGNAGCSNYYQALIFPTALSNSDLAALTA